MRHDRDLLPGRDWPAIADSQAGPFRAEQWAGESWSALSWWKWWALDEWLSTHPEIQRLVWIEDDLQKHGASAEIDSSQTRAAWTVETALRKGARVEALLLAPDKHLGLRPLDLKIVEDWILGVG